MNTTPAPGTPTQVAHPWRSVVRTLVATATGIVLAWLARTLGIDLTDFSDAMIDSITGFVWGVGTAFAQWVLTRPAVERFLQRFLPGLATGVHTER